MSDDRQRLRNVLTDVNGIGLESASPPAVVPTSISPLHEAMTIGLHMLVICEADELTRMTTTLHHTRGDGRPAGAHHCRRRREAVPAGGPGSTARPPRPADSVLTAPVGPHRTAHLLKVILGSVESPWALATTV